jgi:hemolysin activation/secretion protein
MVLAFGGGHIFSKNYEYFQALSLGVNNPNIHGFRKNRYSGSSLLYGSFEVRLKLFDVNSYILPGPVGITGFYDVGRVWLKHEESKKYHGAVGGGLYFVPFNSFIISATAGFSGNERLLNFNIGTRVNLSF